MNPPTPSTTPAPPAPPKQGGRFSPLMLALGGCGCVVLLCIFGISAVVVAGGQGLLASLFETPTPTAKATLPSPPTVPASPTVARGATVAARVATSTPQLTAVAPSRSTPTRAPAGRTPPAINLTSLPPVRLTPLGTAPTTGRGFGQVRFAAGVLDDEKPIDVLESFPSGMTIIYAIFEYAGMENVQTWKREWLLNGKSDPDLIKEGDWNGGPSGTWWVSLYNDKGITPGEWTLNLSVDGRQQQAGKMRIETATTPNFSPISFAEGRDAQGNPVDPVAPNEAVFYSGITEVFAFFNGVNVPRNTAYTTQWFRNGASSTTEATFNWNAEPNGSNSVRFFNTDGAPLSTGVYEFKIKIAGRLVKLASFTILD